MQYRNNKTRSSRAMTLVEMLIAMAIMAIIFAALVPQFRLINNSWDSKVGASETLQNGRVLIDHINRNLSKASRITAVSDSSEINGYIEFIDNDANNVRYDVNSISDYAQFGLIGSPSDLAGPVSQLQFTCYDSNDFTTPITDVNSIRFVIVQTTVTNSAMLDQDMTFTAQAYIRTNALPAPLGDILILDEPWFRYDTSQGMEPALWQIDQIHYLYAYYGPSDNGWAVVLTVDTDTWDVSKEVAFEYDEKNGIGPALAQIDQTHYLCAYQGEDDDGWVRILKVNTGSWTISEEDSFEFDQDDGVTPALIQIDQTHYLCAYEGDLGDGWAVVLSIASPDFDAISMETPFEFDTSRGATPALSQIDATHYLCVYTGLAVDGFAVVLTINTGNWTISKETPFEYDTSNGEAPALYKIDNTHYLCAYGGLGSDGWVNILKVDTGNWTITEEYDFEFDTGTGQEPALAQIDQTHYLCAYRGSALDGWSVVLNVDSVNWTISMETPLEFDSVTGNSPALAKIDDSHYLCVYTGPGDDGFAGVLEVSEEIRP
ncbi:MAG: prepilin-type N-terminal cleavage/methylation domain-containing protein [Planctomycetes bacterium]|nr:prepilin-type N-terminal cleavage/methylation domain-containing protein [Planctomycetota bacterium]